MSIIVAILVFGAIVLFHEYGHFIVARKNGIIVDEFMIGFGPKIVGFKRGDTTYSIRILPLGGACMMRGEDEDDPDAPPEPGSFNSKSVWARMAVIFAGPFFNFIMAFVCAAIILSISGYTSGGILEVQEDSPAAEAGLESGDVITKVDSTRVVTFSDFSMYVALSSGKDLDVTYERGGEKYETTITPELTDDGVYRIGIVGGVVVKPGPLGVLGMSFHEVGANIRLVYRSLELMISGKVSKNDISGPVGMFQIIGESYSEAAQYGAVAVILTISNLILLLSANLGVMNLLPIPSLDGGRLVFLVIEAIRGKPVPREMEGRVHFIGFVCLMILMVLIMYNDFARIFGF